jgi:DNA-binding CsgD family transcriptional regulator/DNA-binding transcriptional MerR regulator
LLPNITPHPFASLTPKQIKIASLISQGLIDKDVASKMNYKEYSLKNLNRVIFQKLGIANRVQLTTLAQSYAQLHPQLKREFKPVKSRPVLSMPTSNFDNVYIISLLRRGLSDKEISKKMRIAKSTAKSRLGRLFRQVGIKEKSSKRSALLSWFENNPKYKKTVDGFDSFISALSSHKGAIRFATIRNSLNMMGISLELNKTQRTAKILKDYTKYRIILRTINQETRAKMIEANHKGMSVRNGARYAGVTAKTLQKYWKIEGLPAHYKFGNSNQKRITEEQKFEIFQSHRLGMSIEKAAKYAKVCCATICRLWKEEKLNSHGKYIPALTEAQKNKLKQAHELEMSIKQAQKYTGVSVRTICYFWKSQGLKPHNKAPSFLLSV